jgi:hypothetical protein
MRTQCTFNTPVGICCCGCGQPVTTVQPEHRPSRGYVKGQPAHFIGGHGHTHRGLSVLDYLWSKIDRSAGPDACWPWTGCRQKVSGYGAVAYQGKQYNAHHLLFVVLNGPLKLGELVRHTCDWKPCCNPAHLLRGSHHQNTRDAVERRLFKHSEAHYRATLTTEQVREIRRMHAERHAVKKRLPASDPGSIPALAIRFGVHTVTIFDIVHRRTWVHVDSQSS